MSSIEQWQNQLQKYASEESPDLGEVQAIKSEIEAEINANSGQEINYAFILRLNDLLELARKILSGDSQADSGVGGDENEEVPEEVADFLDQIEAIGFDLDLHFLTTEEASNELSTIVSQVRKTQYKKNANILVAVFALREKILQLQKRSHTFDGDSWENSPEDHPPQLVQYLAKAEEELRKLDDVTYDPRTQLVESVTGERVSIDDYFMQALQYADDVCLKFKMSPAFSDLDKGQIIIKLYATKFREVLSALEKRIGLLDEKKFNTWRDTFDQSADAEQMNKINARVFVDAELERAQQQLAAFLKNKQASYQRKFGENSREYEHVSKFYLGRLQEKIAQIEKSIVEIQEDKKRNEDILGKKDFELAVADIVQLLDEIEGIDRDDKIRSSYLNELRENLNRKSRILNEPVFTNQFSSRKEDTNYLRARIQTAIGRIAELLPVIEFNELRYMPLEELARLTRKDGADPFLFEVMREGGITERKAEIAQAAKERLFGANPDHTPMQELDRVKWFVWLQLGITADKLQHQTQMASGSKTAGADSSGMGGSLQQQLADRIVAREDMATALAHNPVWGNEYTQLVDAAIVQAALKAFPKDADRARYQDADVVAQQLIRDNKEREPIMSKQGQVVLFKGRIYKYSFASSYRAFTGERTGRKNLLNFLKNFKIIDADGSKRVADAEAIEFANEAYLAYCFLDDSFLELQASTMTRAHNPAEPDILSLNKGTAVSPHRRDRYKNPADWTQLWWVIYDLTNIPEYYFLNNNVRKSLLETVHFHLLHARCFYPTDKFEGKLPFPKFLEHTFPTTRALTEMQPGESLWVACPDPNFVGFQLVNHENKVLLRKDTDGRVFNLAGDYLGTVVESDRSSDDDADEDQQAGEFILPGPGGRSIPVEDALVTIGQNPDGTPIKVKVTESMQSRELYYTAMRGFDSIVRLTFGEIQAGLSEHQIIQSVSSGKPGILNQYLSAWGMAKMFLGPHIDTYAEPMMIWFLYRILHAFKPNAAADRRKLVKDIYEAISQASMYGGLGYKHIRLQTENVLRALTDEGEKPQEVEKYRDLEVTKWDEQGNTSRVMINLNDAVRPYEQLRREHIIRFLKHWWHHEHHEEEMPPIDVNYTKMAAQIKAWRISQRLKLKMVSKAQEDIIRYARMEDGKIALPHGPISRDVGAIDVKQLEEAKSSSH
ncbi:MAG: hypothetical protein WAU07_01020 [Microgenomates group bacterium]